MLKRFLLPGLLVLAACGAGGEDTPIVKSIPPGPGPEIATYTLDQGNVGHTYFQQLEAEGGTQPYTWWVASTGDAVPPGLELLPDGRLAGLPSQAAVASLVVVCQGAESRLDTTTLRIEVRDVEITPHSVSNVTPGTSVQFEASGGSAGYAFSLVMNQSGASINDGGSYLAGAEAGVDLVRATDTHGFFEEVTVTVGDNPFQGFTAQWGTTDVWWMDWDVVYTPSPTYATDFDEVLADMGLRDPDSTDREGTEADQLARLLVIRRTLGHLSSYYGNGMDGAPRPGGLSISFVGPNPPAEGFTPTVGDITGAQSGAYNTICLRYGPAPGVIGTAYLDFHNDSIEHNCGDPTGTPLGIFTNQLLGPYLSVYRNAMVGDPVNASDVDGLRSMLYGDPPEGARQEAIFDVADNYARTLAAVLAHEIAHSLGLNHTSPAGGAGDMMNAILTLGRDVEYAFNPEHWAALMDDLPGPRRD